MKNITRQHRVVASATNPISNEGGRNLASLGSLATKTRSLFTGAVVAFAIAGCGGGGGGGSDSGGGASTEPTPAPVVNQAPTDITLSNSAIAENSPAGSFIGTIVATDSDTDSSNITYSFGGGADDSNFTIDENNLSIKASPDYEIKPSYSIDIIADDGELNFTKTLTIIITDINDNPPTITSSDTATAHENISDTASIVQVAHSDIDTENGTTTYSITQNDNDMFEIDSDGNISRKSVSFDYETKSSYSIKVKVNDGAFDSGEQTIVISISDINDVPPVITTTTASANENITDSETIVQVIHTDSDTVNGTTTYSLTQNDSDMFEITSAGAVSLKSGKSLDYETKDNYSIKVKANDGVQDSSEQTISISITNINEAPTNLSLSYDNIDENVADGTTIGTLSAIDLDSGDILSYSFGGGTDDSSFSISDDKLNINLSPDRETKSSYNIKLKATDSGGLMTTKSFTITINDINEAPTDISLANNNIDENVPDGTTVATLTTDDPDSGDILTYSFNSGTDDSYFTIAGDKLNIKTSPDFETKSSYSIKLKARDSSGLFIAKDFVITINDIYDPFIIKIKTDNDGNSLDNEFTVPTRDELTYSYDIDCNYDGTFDAIATGQTDDYTCSYGAVGEYTVAIAGDFPAIIFDNNSNDDQSDSLKLLEIQAWGDIEWSSMIEAFEDTRNMTMTATDKPDLRNVTDMSEMFFRAYAFNGDIGDWNVSNVTNMSSMFWFAKAFNGDIGDWNVSNVTNMSRMFDFAYTFDQNIRSWDVSNVTDMSYMFRGLTDEATGFNQDVSDWNVSKVTNMQGMFSQTSNFDQDISDWDVSSVINMQELFANTKVFNQDIGKWDVSNVTNMRTMFFYSKAFNQDIGDWNVSKVTNMHSMFLRTEAFNQDIHNWDVQNVTDWSEFSANSSSEWSADDKPNF